MKLKDRLISMRDAVTESIEEFAETSELSAEEYAKYYGASYTNFLDYIKKQQFKKMTEEYNEGRAQSIDDVELMIVLPIVSYKDKEIIFADEAFGAKEVFNVTILKNLLYKARISCEINEDSTSMTLTKDTTERISDRVDKLVEDKDAYIAKAKEMVNVGNEIARNKTKELLKKASDWANNNL